jgi:uncharacterized repeat protein (TIGR03803 family)
MKKIPLLVFALFCLGMGTVRAQYTDLLNFNDSVSPQGKTPVGALILSGNRFFGMTQNGGTSSFGVVFTVQLNGSGYKNLFNFDGLTGRHPQGSLTLFGNKLYGMTYQGGGNGLGNIFSLDTDGTGYKDFHDFGTYPDDASPSGNVTLSGGVLYGMTQWGGTYNDGIIFSIDTNGNGYKILFNFDSANISSFNSFSDLPGTISPRS